MFAGFGALAYYRFPQYFSGIQSYVLIGACGLIGAGLQKGIVKAVIFVLGPLGRFLTFYEKLLELEALKSRGTIDKSTHTQLVQKLCENRFIGS